MSKGRQWEFDALRGLMLVLMTVTHLPTRLSSPLGQPFGFVSAAEGFVLLSAYMAGLVYSRLAYRDSIDAMRQAFWRRALKVYMCQAATLLFLFTFIAALGLKVDQPAVKDLMSYYLRDPHAAFVAGLLLIYEPPLLDILPMYVLFMLASPWVLAWALRHSWRGVLAGSLLLWVLAQFGLGSWIYRLTVGATGMSVPFNETGSFATFGWQLLWMVGLWMGASRNAPDAKPFRFPSGVVLAAVGIAVAGLVWRHVEGQAPFGADESLNLLFDKWLLGPLRILDLVALGIVTIRFGPVLARHMPRQRWLETLGSASLPVFCAHLVVVLLVLAVFGGNPLAHSWWVDALLLVVCFSALHAVAWLTLWLERRAALRAKNEASPPAAQDAPNGLSEAAVAEAAPLQSPVL
jgi:hypothetical protein